MVDDQSLDEQYVAGVAVGFWNPVRPDSRGRVRHVGNMGDLLGPLVTQLALGAGDRVDGSLAASSRRLLTIGSIAHFARPGDVLWGTGVNGKSLASSPRGMDLDIRAVRGPWTAAELTYQGYDVPLVFGDPALLMQSLLPDPPRLPQWSGLRLVVPNFHSFGAYHENVGLLQQQGLTLLSPHMPLLVVLSAIAHAEFVVGSSLHAIILADAYGVPARLIRSETEPEFKYYDYLLGSGRMRPRLARDVSEALDLGAHEPAEIDAEGLMAAFPRDLWDADSVLPTAEAVFSIAPDALSLWRERATGRASREQLAERLTELPRNSAEESPDANAISEARRLALPDTLAACATARLREARWLADDALLAISFVHDSGVKLPQTIELQLDAVDSGRRITLPWHLFEQQRTLWRLDLDFIVPLADLDGDDIWHAFVLADGEAVPVTEGNPLPLRRGGGAAPSEADAPIVLSVDDLRGAR